MAVAVATINIVVFVILVVLQSATIHVHSSCVSSCGDIRNISYPFRVKGDPEECGDKRYEIDCDNKVPIVSVFSGKYYVKEIDYKNYTIRLVDPGFAFALLDDQPSNCSSTSTPQYLLSKSNFSDYYRDPYYVLSLDSIPVVQVVYLRCREAVDHPFYVNVTTSNDDGSAGYKYNYAFITDYYVYAKDVRVGCHVKSMVLVDWKNYNDEVNKNIVSYVDIHTRLLHGFTLRLLGDYCDVFTGPLRFTAVSKSCGKRYSIYSVSYLPNHCFVSVIPSLFHIVVNYTLTFDSVSYVDKK